MYSFEVENLHLARPESWDKLVTELVTIFRFDPLQHGVQHDEGACPAHTSAAVHQQQVLPVVRMRLPHSLDGDGIGGHSMVRLCTSRGALSAKSSTACAHMSIRNKQTD